VVIDDALNRPDYVFVGVWWGKAEELNLLPPGAIQAGSVGATIKGELHVAGPGGGGGGTVNIEYAVITGRINVAPGAKVTIKGKHFAVSGNAKLDDPENPTIATFIGGGTLSVTYGNGTTKDLRFYHTYQEVYLEAPKSVIDIGVDIKPDSDENVINPKSKGLIPVAVFSTASFDATQIDPTTVDLAGAKVAARGNGGKLMAHSEDVNSDGKLDLMLQVELPSEGAALARAAGAAWVTGEIKLSGATFDGQAVEGSDKITVISAEE